ALALLCLAEPEGQASQRAQNGESETRQGQHQLPGDAADPGAVDWQGFLIERGSAAAGSRIVDVDQLARSVEHQVRAAAQGPFERLTHAHRPGLSWLRRQGYGAQGR